MRARAALDMGPVSSKTARRLMLTMKCFCGTPSPAFSSSWKTSTAAGDEQGRHLFMHRRRGTTIWKQLGVRQHSIGAYAPRACPVKSWSWRRGLLRDSGAGCGACEPRPGGDPQGRALTGGARGTEARVSTWTPVARVCGTHMRSPYLPACTVHAASCHLFQAHAFLHMWRFSSSGSHTVQVSSKMPSDSDL